MWIGHQDGICNMQFNLKAQPGTWFSWGGLCGTVCGVVNLSLVSGFGGSTLPLTDLMHAIVGA